MAILGVDEVGRGPFAGPLVMGAVILPEDAKSYSWYNELRDSKKIAFKKRMRIAEELHRDAAVTLGWVAAKELDRIGMMAALRLATRRAVKAAQKSKVPFSEIIIDGDTNFLAGTLLEPYTTTVVKGDNLIKEVSAASIVAKHARDSYMIALGEKYPEYGFEQHMGYGTKQHKEAMCEYGLCPEHRRITKPVREIAQRDGENLSGIWTKAQKKNTTKIGRKAEDIVAEFLQDQGHMIVEQNFRTKYCEIDIVSADIVTMKLFFTEVKYRKNGERGGGIAAVDSKKREQMEFAVKVFLARNPDFKDYDPLLTVAEVTGGDFEVTEWVALV